LVRKWWRPAAIAMLRLELGPPDHGERAPLSGSAPALPDDPGNVLFGHAGLGGLLGMLRR